MSLGFADHLAVVGAFEQRHSVGGLLPGDRPDGSSSWRVRDRWCAASLFRMQLRAASTAFLTSISSAWRDRRPRLLCERIIGRKGLSRIRFDPFTVDVKLVAAHLFEHVPCCGGFVAAHVVPALAGCLVRRRHGYRKILIWPASCDFIILIVSACMHVTYPECHIVIIFARSTSLRCCGRRGTSGHRCACFGGSGMTSSNKDTTDQNRIRFHRRRRGLGRLRAGQPAERRRRAPGPADRGRRAGQQHQHPYSADGREPAQGRKIYLAVHDREAGASQRQGAIVGAGQGARRIQLDQRQRLCSRRPGRISIPGAVWAAPGWSWEDMLPYFKRMETFASGDPVKRGKSGPINVTQLKNFDKLGDAYLDASQEAGFELVDDYNDGHYEGSSYLQYSTTPRGFRCSSAVGYLRPAQGRSNLEVWTNTLVDQSSAGRQARRRGRVPARRQDGPSVEPQGSHRLGGADSVAEDPRTFGHRPPGRPQGGRDRCGA